MLNALKNESNYTFTENGALTLRSTGNNCLDLFATIGALRSATDDEIRNRFLRAWAEERNLAMKILFYARDVRGGLGERRVFRVCLKELCRIAPDSVRKNLFHIAEYGRWDDILCLMGTPCERDAVAAIKIQLAKDLVSEDHVSLLAKWLPSVNATNSDTVHLAKRLARKLEMTDAKYRRMLSTLRERIRILENNLRTRDYTFDYEQQPSGAMFKYRKAFERNDLERYQAFLNAVAKGEKTLHTDTLYPYQVIRAVMNGDTSLDTVWNTLPDFTNNENALVVMDGSGSMYGYSSIKGISPKPIEMAMSLALYYAQRNRGVFHNHFITFSTSPRLVEIKGETLAEQVNYCMGYNEVANTNIQKVFELILSAALREHIPQKEMPSALYIITDMEFDRCAAGAEMTNFEYARQLFEKHGYTLPRVVFWNVESRNEQQPVAQNEQGVTLVSGASARVFQMLSANALTPEAFMRSVLDTERYKPIAA